MLHCVSCHTEAILRAMDIWSRVEILDTCELDLEILERRPAPHVGRHRSLDEIREGCGP